ncbi:MAG: ABC transporter ATP-binding protein [Gammaproteobacteria bacterium]|nr:ABC transporter ATP-binding protein [Gammaproteobacteria bacterium]
MLLRVEHLHYAYEEAGHLHDVLQDVSLSLRQGERIALLGSSGSGKSTLLNLIGGIDEPSHGTITIANNIITSLTEPDLTLLRRQHIGFIYQQFNLIPTLTTAENILLPLELLGFSSREQKQRLTYWLEAIGLAERGQSFPDHLSGGEQQRVSIARALIHQPALVLADEPTGNLDAQNGQQILNLLFDLAHQHNQSLLIVTHSKAVADRADRTLILEQGVLHEGGQDITW